MRNRQHFQRRFGGGSPVFQCQVCERNTRDTGQGVDHLCEQCFEIAGWDNTVNDSGYKPGDGEFEKYRAICDGELAKAVKLGGNADKIKDSNGYIWGQDPAPAPVAPAAAPTPNARFRKRHYVAIAKVFAGTAVTMNSDKGALARALADMFTADNAKFNREQFLAAALEAAPLEGANIECVDDRTISFHTVDYEMSHGRGPRGRGSWAFFFERHAPVDEAFWVHGNVPYAEAKRRARIEARRRGKTVVYVGS